MNIDYASPEQVKRLQEEARRISQPFLKMADKVLAVSTPKLLVSQEGIKRIYPYNTLKALVYIRQMWRYALRNIYPDYLNIKYDGKRQQTICK